MYLIDPRDANAIVAHGADDAGHVRAVPVLVQHISIGGVCIEVSAVDVVHDACR